MFFSENWEPRLHQSVTEKTKTRHLGFHVTIFEIPVDVGIGDDAAAPGAVLNPLNYRLDARTLTFMLGHAEAKILIVDREYSRLALGQRHPNKKSPSWDVTLLLRS